MFKADTFTKLTINCKTEGICGSSTRSTPPRAAAPNPIRWSLRKACEDFTSGLGSEIKQGDDIYAPSAPGYATYTREDMVLVKLKKKILIKG